MDEMDGLQLFSEIQKVHPGMPVIILTAHGSIPDAVAATQQGVFGFLTKPVDKDALYKAIDDALEHSAPATDERWRQAIVTRSPLMLRLLEQAGMVAQSDVSVLINGQSGTGKRLSRRRFIMPARATTNLLSPLTAARCRSSCWNPSYLAMRAARLPARSATGRGCSRPRKAGRCFSMRSAICRWRYR
jgi:succinate dehydrogenase/fumarate reductase flavoprotein subunit